MRSRAIIVATLLVACGVRDGAPAAEIEELVPQVLAEYPHDPEAFTQGLIWHAGRLYESTGEYGSSSLRRVNLETGEIERRFDLDDGLFGEGLERVGSRLIQLTWREETALVYDLETLRPVARLSYGGEGWGLCFDEVDLIRSAGTATLTFHDAGSLAQLRQVEVTLAGRPLLFLNELECVHGQVWANVWQTDAIVRIDPASGRVTARVDASALRDASPGHGVLNGIAYRSERDTFLLTGKNWSKVFEVTFVAP